MVISLIARIRAASNASAIDASTMNRLAAMQLCPLLMHRDAAAAAAAAETSASASTRNGSLPPSSITVFFSAAPAWAATIRPAASLPVSVTAAMVGCSMIALITGVSTSSVVNTPSGKPASTNSFSSSSAMPLTLGACFSTPTLPAIRLGAAKRITCQSGKFQGMIASTGPSGSKRTNAVPSVAGNARLASKPAA